ncbi:MAG: hypothetical protein ACPF9D_08955 [Owenweeksia sp.]
MSSQNQNYLLLALSSVLVTLFLFFIDEGYYDFRWMKDWGNWIVFVIYVAGIYFGQWLVYNLLNRFYNGKSRMVLSITGGTVLGLFMVMGLILYVL